MNRLHFVAYQFSMHQGMNCNFWNDIASMPLNENVEECKAECASRTDCAAFVIDTGTCWFKKTIMQR